MSLSPHLAPLAVRPSGRELALKRVDQISPLTLRSRPCRRQRIRNLRKCIGSHGGGRRSLNGFSQCKPNFRRHRGWRTRSPAGRPPTDHRCISTSGMQLNDLHVSHKRSMRYPGCAEIEAQSWPQTSLHQNTMQAHTTHSCSQTLGK